MTRYVLAVFALSVLVAGLAAYEHVGLLPLLVFLAAAIVLDELFRMILAILRGN